MRRVLVDALIMCLERSKVREKVDPQALQSVLNAAAGELWREGEFRLEYVWKILCQQPGVVAADVAPPLFLFKAHEEELGVNVRLPQALTAVPRPEQERLRDQLGIKQEDFANALAELKSLAASDEARKVEAAAAAAERRSAEPAPPSAQPEYAPPAPAAQKRLGTGAALAIMGGALTAFGLALFLTYRNPAGGFDTSDVSSMLRLEAGVRAGPSAAAKIADPRWNTLSREQQQKLAEQIFDVELGKGIRSLTLTDESGRVRVQATEAGGAKAVSVR
jgi:hypothetical protein